MISDLLFHTSTHEFCMKILDRLPGKWLKKYAFFLFFFLISWNGIRTCVAAQPNGFSYYFHIWSQWSRTVVKIHGLFFSFAIRKERNCKSSEWENITKQCEKAQSRASCSVAEQEIWCSHSSLMKPLGSTICWHDKTESVPNPVFWLLFLADILRWKESMSNIHRSHYCKWSQSNLWVNKLSCEKFSDPPRKHFDAFCLWLCFSASTDRSYHLTVSPHRWIWFPSF